MSRKLLNTYSTYLKEKYNSPVYRVGIDAGFSCPNRKGGRKSPGCTYCDEYGAAAVYNRHEGHGEINDRFSSCPDKLKLVKNSEIEGQIDKGIRFLSDRYKAEKFLLYFQSFSSTNADTDTLRGLYRNALQYRKFEELIVSTRPDCINEEKADLLAEFRSSSDVWVELGLQSIHNATLERIRRGHTLEDFESAYILLRERGIKICVHMIFGLPGETWSEMEKSVLYIAKQYPEAVKLHNLHIPLYTDLYYDYLEGEISVPSSERYLQYVLKALELLPEDVIIQRLTCDTPKIRRAAPRQFWKKTYFHDKVISEMKVRSTYQGRCYKAQK